jgi:hypothetical protein
MEKTIKINPVTKPIIAFICLAPSPRTFVFWRTAKIKVKTKTKGKT